MSRAHLDTGDKQAALAVIEAKPEPDRDFYWVASMCQLALLGLTLELDDVCDRVIEGLTPFRGRLAVIGLGIGISHQVSTALGHAHEGRGEFALAEELYREAVAQADEIGFPYFAAIARRHLAQTLLRQDADNAEALQLLSHVVAAAQAHGFGEELQIAEGLLDRQ